MYTNSKANLLKSSLIFVISKMCATNFFIPENVKDQAKQEFKAFLADVNNAQLYPTAYYISTLMNTNNVSRYAVVIVV